MALVYNQTWERLADVQTIWLTQIGGLYTEKHAAILYIDCRWA